MTKMLDPSSVTWTEFGSLIGVGGMIALAIVGYVIRQQSQQATAINELRSSIQDHRIEVAQSYATIKAVQEVEKRLTESLNQIMAQISKEMSQMTVSIQQLFGELIHRVRKDDTLN